MGTENEQIGQVRPTIVLAVCANSILWAFNKLSKDARMSFGGRFILR